MCGILAAFTELDGLEPALGRALHHMRRRGPDGEGLWRAPGVYLGHRRLAILDLDARADQPMHSACGRYVLVLNGEIYNFQDLRNDLARRGATFRTTSDSEVLLELFAREGEAMLPRLDGMFALVIWDRERRRGFAARDPYGIKPLYCADMASGVLLASQVKALLVTGLVSREPDALGQAGFWLLGSVPEPHTWFRAVRALPAGHSVWIEHGRLGAPHHWADLGATWRGARPALVSRDEGRAAVRTAVRESVARHLVADVPVGVFLSGGIDSGALAGLMAEAGAGLEGVTVAYDEFAGTAQDEAPLAAGVAARYGIRHHIRRVTRDEFLSDLPRILDAMDQPTIDGINTWYASKAVAERGLKVVVSGVGGDELFHGYTSFRTLPRLVRYSRRLAGVPGMAALANVAGRLLARRTGNDRWRHVGPWAQSIESAWWLRRSLNAPEALADLMPPGLVGGVVESLDVSNWVVTMAGELPADPVLALSQIESATYLRNQLLRDSDWASMDHGVELRTPLVDARLLQTLQPVLTSFAGRGKRWLGEAPQPPLPERLLARQKAGFGIPVGRWLAERPDAPPVDSRAWAVRVAAAYDQRTGGVFAAVGPD